MTNEAKAVAYRTHDDPITTVPRIVTSDDFDTPEDMHLIARVNGWEPLYPATEVERLEARIRELEPDARRYKFLRERRHVLLVTGFFGNCCVNMTMDNVDAEIDAITGATP